MSRLDYHGQFEHPVRAFAFGVGLILLLGGGFRRRDSGRGQVRAASGVETVVQKVGTLRVVTVPTPVTTTVVRDGVSKVVEVPRTRVVIVKQKGHSVLGFLENGASTAALSPTTLLVPNVACPRSTATVTETQLQTVTENHDGHRHDGHDRHRPRRPAPPVRPVRPPALELDAVVRRARSG